MGVASGCGEQEVGVASGSGWNLWVWLLYHRRRKQGGTRGTCLPFKTYILAVPPFKMSSFLHNMGINTIY